MTIYELELIIDTEEDLDLLRIQIKNVLNSPQLGMSVVVRSVQIKPSNELPRAPVVNRLEQQDKEN